MAREPGGTDVQTNRWMDGLKDGPTNIFCILQDNAPLAPLPIRQKQREKQIVWNEEMNGQRALGALRALRGERQKTPLKTIL